MAASEHRDDEFVGFLGAHEVSLFRTAYLMTGSAEAAEELLQDTVVRLYPRWERVSNADSPVAYVRRSLVNAFISQRRTSGARTVPLSVVADVAQDGDRFAVVDDRSQLWHLLLGLPARQRAALVLRFFEDLPDREIAGVLGCREATVRSLVSRGLASLRRLPAEELATRSEGSEG